MNDTYANAHSFKIMMDFFHTYHVLFCAVWDGNLSDAVLEDWFRGEITWDALIEQFDFYEEYSDKWKEFQSKVSDKTKLPVEILTDFCRKYQLVNLRD